MSLHGTPQRRTVSVTSIASANSQGGRSLNSTPQRRTASITSVASVHSQNGQSPSTGGVIERIANLSLLSVAKRPSPGTLGTRVSALVNLFDIDIPRMPDLIQYSFKIRSKEQTDAQISGRYRARVAALLLGGNDRFQSAASDYSNLFVSVRPLTPDDKTAYTYEVDYFEVEESGPRSGDHKLVFHVTLAFNARFRMQNLQSYLSNRSNDYSAIQQHINAVNIVLARSPSQNPNMTTTARREKFSHIIPSNGRRNLGLGLEVISGFYRSARVTLSGVQINLNTAACAMYQEGSLHTVIGNILGNLHFKRGEDRLRYLDTQLADVRVEISYLGRPVRKKFFRMARSKDKSLRPTSANVVFDKDGSIVTVQEHFATTYPNVHRTNMDALVINLGGGGNGRAVYIPADLCYVFAGQPYRGFLPNAIQTSNMIKFACRLPDANATLILNDGLPQMGVGVQGGLRDRFGINVSTQMMTVNGRCLPSPSLDFASGLDRRTSSGSWNLSAKLFKTPASVDTTTITCLQILPPAVQACSNMSEFVSGMQLELQKYTRRTSIAISRFTGFDHTVRLPAEFGVTDLSTPLSQLAKKGAKLVLVILPNKSRHTYRYVKLAADATGSGIHTVCVAREEKGGHLNINVDKLANIALKINFKLGGINWGLVISTQVKGIFEKKVMFVGADVVHPGKNSMIGAPSISSVVASYDTQYASYPGSVRFQFPKLETKKAVEFIEHFGAMMEARLNFFRQQNNGMLPDTIFIYRDGVADNMFAEVLTQEMLQVQRAYKKLYVNRPLPQTVLIVTQKRIHIRFYKSKAKSGSGFDRNGNPLPGFVVDTAITSRSAHDFYIVAHKGLQGTCRPVRHIVLHDDLNLGSDTLQYITYSLSFLFQRSTKSISTPAPVRCADRLAWRAKTFFDDVYNPPPILPGEPKQVYRGNDPSHWQGQLASNIKDTMFYL